MLVCSTDISILYSAEMLEMGMEHSQARWTVWSMRFASANWTMTTEYEWVHTDPRSGHVDLTMDSDSEDGEYMSDEEEACTLAEHGCPTCRKRPRDAACGFTVYVEAKCPVCLEQAEPIVALPCGHVLCKQCYEGMGGLCLATLAPGVTYVQSNPMGAVGISTDATSSSASSAHYGASAPLTTPRGSHLEALSDHEDDAVVTPAQNEGIPTAGISAGNAERSEAAPVAGDEVMSASAATAHVPMPESTSAESGVGHKVPGSEEAGCEPEDSIAEGDKPEEDELAGPGLSKEEILLKIQVPFCTQHNANNMSVWD